MSIKYTSMRRTPEAHAREIHTYKTNAYPTLQTVVRWSICWDLSWSFALRDKGPYGPPQPSPIKGRKVPPLGATLVGPEPEIFPSAS